MSLQGIRLVTFDATNTLLKFRVPPWEYYTHIAREYGFRGTEQQIHKKFYENYKLVWKYYPNFGSDSIGWNAWWKHLIKRTFREYYELSGNIDKLSHHLIEDFKTSKCWAQADAASELINNLREKNISVGIISNFDPRLYNVLDAVGFNRNNFEFVLTSYETKILKPNPKIFDLALKSCARLDSQETLRNERIIAPESLHIGDDYEKDYCAAREAGWKALLILNNKQVLHRVPPQNMFQSLASLNSLLINKDKKSIPIQAVEPTDITPPYADANTVVDTIKKKRDQSQIEQNNKTPIAQKGQTSNEVKMQKESTTPLAKNCIVYNHTYEVPQMAANNLYHMQNHNLSMMEYPYLSTTNENDKEESTELNNYSATEPELYKYSKETQECIYKEMPLCDSEQDNTSQNSACYSNQWCYPYQGYNSYHNYYNQGNLNDHNHTNQPQNTWGFNNNNWFKN